MSLTRESIPAKQDQMEGLIAGELESCLARGNPSQGFFRTGERFLVTTSYVFPCLLAYTIASDTVPRRRTRARVGDSICILYSSLLGRSPFLFRVYFFQLQRYGQEFSISGGGVYGHTFHLRFVNHHQRLYRGFFSHGRAFEAKASGRGIGSDGKPL